MMALSAPGPPQDISRNRFCNSGRKRNGSAGLSLAASIETIMERCIIFLLPIYSAVSSVFVTITVRPSTSSSAGKGKKSLSRPSTHRYGTYKRAQSAGDKSYQTYGAEEEEDDDDDGKSFRVRKSKRPKTNCDGRLLACPYYKFNPLEHNRCLLRNRLTDTSFVVQHVLRTHNRQPIHCPVCGNVFDTHTERDSHIQAQSCERREVRYEGLTQDQVNRLRVPRRHLNEVKRWFSIWDIIFPNTPRPDSPYVGSEAEEMIGTYRRMLGVFIQERSLGELFSRLQTGQGASQPSDPGDMAVTMGMFFQLLDPGTLQYVSSVIPRQDNLSFLASDALAPGYQLLNPAEQQAQPRLQSSSTHQHQLQDSYGPSQFQDLQVSSHITLQHVPPGGYNISPHVHPAALLGGFPFPIVFDASASNTPPHGEAPIEPELHPFSNPMPAPYSQGFTTSGVLDLAQSDFSVELADTLAVTDLSSAPPEKGQPSADPRAQPDQCLGSIEPD